MDPSKDSRDGGPVGPSSNQNPLPVLTLAPILETDDINVENEHHAEPPSMGVEHRRGSERGSVLMSTLEQVRMSMAKKHETSRGVVANVTDWLLRLLEPPSSGTSPEAIRAMPRRARVSFYLSQPTQSRPGWILHHLILLVLFINVAVMAAETLDGPLYGSSDPAYDYIPGDSFFLATEAGFTALYIVEFALRLVSANKQRMFWRSLSTWIMIVACIPFPLYEAYASVFSSEPDFDALDSRQSFGMLRVFRAIRIVDMSRVYDGTDVMFKAMKNSFAPLKITFFFLITVVMVFATAIFYAEPCYDLKTCTFTDIFNAGYFVMITVATVGYGSQVPSLYNGGSLALTIVVMIFGSLYLAMPLAIVGIRYDSAWREFEAKKNPVKRTSSLLGDEAVSAIRLAVNKKRDDIDEALKPLEARKVLSHSYKICDRFYTMSSKIGEVNELIECVFEAPRDSTLDMAIQSAKNRNDYTTRSLEAIMAVLKIHKRICTDVRSLVPAENLQGPVATQRRSRSAGSMTAREGSFSKTATMASGIFGRARRALTMRTKSEQLKHTGPATWRSKVWDILEHHDLSHRAVVINKIRLIIVLLSIALFYAQTTPELQLTGVASDLCRRSIGDFCKTSTKGYSDQPGCFVLDAQGKPTSSRLRFDCASSANDPQCYGNGFNYGSSKFPATCPDVFGRKGVQRVCNNRLCKPSMAFWLNMEPYWIYFEFFFGILFTVEMALVIRVHPQRGRVLSDFTFIVDVITLIPFYVELGEIIYGIMPVYSVVPTAPSVFTVVRVLKTFRILKLGSHLAGSAVLVRTAKLVYKRLMVPVFFLFMGSVLAGAIFYELERGVVCFVGKQCMWWGKNVLTPEIAGSLPLGKRILVQNERPSIITDMIRSTWFSLVTFTTVGYGDMKPRTSLGRLFDILAMVMSACYTAMPLTLVGGQFYICYEVHLRQKQLEKPFGNGVEPKPSHPKEGEQVPVPMGSLAPPTAQLESNETREPALVSITGIVDDPIIPGLNSPLPVPPAASILTSRRDTSASLEPRRHVISSTEMQILNQFIAIHKVLTQVIEDLSQLNRLGSQRVGLQKTNSTHELITLRDNEHNVERKIKINVDFCMVVCLNFSPVIERIIGTHDAQGRKSMMPSILHTAMGTVGTGME